MVSTREKGERASTPTVASLTSALGSSLCRHLFLDKTNWAHELNTETSLSYRFPQTCLPLVSSQKRRGCFCDYCIMNNQMKTVPQQTTSARGANTQTPRTSAESHRRPDPRYDISDKNINKVIKTTRALVRLV